MIQHISLSTPDASRLSPPWTWPHRDTTFYNLTRLTALCWGPRVTRSPSHLHTSTPTPSVSNPGAAGLGSGGHCRGSSEVGAPRLQVLGPVTEVPGARPGGPSFWLGVPSVGPGKGSVGPTAYGSLSRIQPGLSGQTAAAPSVAVIFSSGSRGTDTAAPSQAPTSPCIPESPLAAPPPNPEGEGSPLATELSVTSSQWESLGPPARRTLTGTGLAGAHGWLTPPGLKLRLWDVPVELCPSQPQ